MIEAARIRRFGFFDFRTANNAVRHTMNETSVLLPVTSFRNG
ncbi:MAG: hypothetical protein AB1728_12425 [Bacteroidota bacterium]